MKKLLLSLAFLTTISASAQDELEYTVGKGESPFGAYFDVGFMKRHMSRGSFGGSFDIEVGGVYRFAPRWFVTLGVAYSGAMNSTYRDSESFDAMGITTNISEEVEMASIRIPARVGYDLGPVAFTAGVYWDHLIKGDGIVTTTVGGSSYVFEGDLTKNKDRDFHRNIPGISLGMTLLKVVTVEYNFGLVKRDRGVHENFLRASLGARFFF